MLYVMIKEEIFLHLQTAMLCLVCEACEAERQHKSLTVSPLSPLKGPHCLETIHTNWLPVQRGARPVWPETAPLDMPAVSVIIKQNKTNEFHNFI